MGVYFLQKDYIGVWISG